MRRVDAVMFGAVVSALVLPLINDANTQSNVDYTIVHSEEESSPVLVSDGEVTIVYGSYVSTSNLQPEPVESAGGIKTYSWIIYPSTYISSIRKVRSKFPQLPDPSILFSGYQIQGTADDETEVVKFLKNGEPVLCSLRRPAPVTITVPVGRYYVDYWLTLRGTSNWTDTDEVGPHSVNLKNGTDWGPYELRVTPNSETKIKVTPYGDNIAFKYVGCWGMGVYGMLNLIDYGCRLGP
jgi:hypothetical protein